MKALDSIWEISAEPSIIGDSLTLSTGQGTRINYDIKYRMGREG